MKVVGLISGGKDSCYNLIRCIELGDEIVCLANLCPPGDLDEIDSFMYQSVAHNGVQLYSEALNLPLYSRKISGEVINQEANYDVTMGDEVEDLYALLSFVIEQHPEVKGVSCGAILSSYQKNRLENVCARLDLQPLCHLWNADQEILFDQILNSGIEAIIVKVAAIGLSEKHLGKTLDQMKEVLLDLNRKYGVHICGEGGEYETFVVDCRLFKKRIILDGVRVMKHSGGNIAPVAYLKLEKMHLAVKS